MSRPHDEAASSLATLRWILESLQRLNERLFDAQLTDESSQLLDAAVELAQVYDKLVKLASEPPLSPTRKKRPNVLDEGVPF